MNELVLVFLLVFMSISIVCELLMIYAFIKLKKLRHRPGIYVIIQVIAHLIVDFHWLSAVAIIRNSITMQGCRFVGALVFYSSTIAFNYILFLTLEIYFSVSQKYLDDFKKRSYYFHAIAQITSIPFLIMLEISGKAGSSKFGACGIEASSEYEIVPVIRNFFYITLILIFMGLSFYKRSKNDDECASALKYHLYVVLGFIITFAPIQIINGVNYPEFHTNQNSIIEWSRNIGALLNAISGAVVFFARFSQKKLLKHLWNSIIGKHEDKISQSVLEINLLPYSNLFQQLDKKVNTIKAQVNNILASLIMVFSDFCTAGIKCMNGEKKWTYEYMNRMCKVTLYNYKQSKRVINSENMKMKNFVYSFDIDKNSEGLNSRYINNSNNTFTFLTYDKKFYLKTFSAEDMQNFSSTFPSYSQRQENSSSSLISIYGFFTIEYEGESALHFVLYENLGYAFKNPKLTIIRGKSYKSQNAINNSCAEFSIDMIKIPASLRKKMMKSIENDTNVLSLVQGLNYYLILAYDIEVSLVQRRKKLITCEGKTAVIGISIEWDVWGTEKNSNEYRESLLKEIDGIFISSFTY
ncbi:hypothetical protein SteCoe_28678 [Stentor coeruleus]|uniref:G-protein coupled receptors family 2 profile 2 domain-containing protein n=1 Tax=Stentor coeruleus TaxID=5963 RepID=A0A1R2B7N5_9CILI|nr:hypothetical protein SteCoe_28678 [Stentor coeruleus]